MGQAVEAAAVAESVRTTLDAFMADDPNLEGAEVEIAEYVDGEPATFGLTINGFIFEIVVREPGQ